MGANAEGYVNHLGVFGEGFGSRAERGIAKKVLPETPGGAVL
jgi:hypothetical protein